MNILYFILFMYNFNSIKDVYNYDEYVLLNFSSSPKFSSYLINKDMKRVDEPRFKIKIVKHKFEGISFINYETNTENLITTFSVDDGYYFLISEKTLMRLTAIKSVDDIQVECKYNFSCNCKCETSEVTKTEFKTEIKYQKETNWWYVIGGTALGFIVGGIVGLNL